MLEIFNNTFCHIQSDKLIMEHLMNIAKKKINKKYSILQNSTCNIHYLYILELLFRTKIYKECKWKNANNGKKSIQNADKLRVLQNK